MVRVFLLNLDLSDTYYLSASYLIICFSKEWLIWVKKHIWIFKKQPANNRAYGKAPRRRRFKRNTEIHFSSKTPFTLFGIRGRKTKRKRTLSETSSRFLLLVFEDSLSLFSEASQKPFLGFLSFFFFFFSKGSLSLL